MKTEPNQSVPDKQKENPALKKKSSVEIVRSKLMQKIQEGKIAPGQRLITTEIARKLGTSQAPVREALCLLAGAGVLEILPKRGFRVRPLTYKDLLDGVRILQVVGALAIRLASDNIKNAKYDNQVQNTVDAILKAGEHRDAQAFFTAISATHRMINNLTDNNYLNPVIDRIHLEYFNLHLSKILPGNWEKYIDNYKKMGKNYKTGDTKELEKTFVKHLDWVITLIKAKAAEDS